VFAPSGGSTVVAHIRNASEQNQAEAARRELEAQVLALRQRAEELEGALAVAQTHGAGPAADPSLTPGHDSIQEPEAHAGTEHAHRQPDRPPRAGAKWSDAVRRLAEVLDGEPEAGPVPGVPSEHTSASINELLASTDEAQRLEGARELAGRADETRALPVLMECLASSDPWVRGTAAFVTGRMGISAAQTVPLLAKLLSDSDIWVRAYAATALGQMGPAAGCAIPAMVTLFGDADPLVSSAAAAAMERIGLPPADCAAGLEALSRHPNERIREAARGVLARLNASAPEE
jgi:hypothetical protein